MIFEKLNILNKWLYLNRVNENVLVLFKEEINRLKNFPEDEVKELILNGELDFYEQFLDKLGKEFYNLTKTEIKLDKINENLSIVNGVVKAAIKFKKLKNKS